MPEPDSNFVLYNGHNPGNKDNPYGATGTNGGGPRCQGRRLGGAGQHYLG
jgi:hypothetical protein